MCKSHTHKKTFFNQLKYLFRILRPVLAHSNLISENYTFEKCKPGQRNSSVDKIGAFKVKTWSLGRGWGGKGWGRSTSVPMLPGHEQSGLPGQLILTVVLPTTNGAFTSCKSRAVESLVKLLDMMSC